MTEYPAIAMQKTGHASLGLHLHHYCAFGFAFAVMLAHIGLLGWSDVEVPASHAGVMLGALQLGVQTGLRVAIVVMLIVLSSVLPDRGLRYLGAAFVLLVVIDSAALLAVPALASSGRYSPGSWGMQLASFSSLAAELAMLSAIMMSTVQHVRTQMRANRHLQVLAHTDSLTGLYNRRYLDTEIEHACQRARRHGTWLSVLMIDIDHFKLFNDAYGHLQGDDCLRRVATVLQRRQQRCDDAACRYGGEEFALILPACDLDAARGLAALLCNDVRGLGIEHARSTRGRVTVSIGIATLRITGDTRGCELLRLADDALYAAKHAGRDTVCDMTQIHPLYPPHTPSTQMAMHLR